MPPRYGLTSHACGETGGAVGEFWLAGDRKLRTLQAVAIKDGTAMNDAIGVLVEEHENEAKRGDNQKSSSGFICLPALMFAHLGSKANLTCTIKSPYLPLQLLKN